jgi:hypothetical protein
MPANDTLARLKLDHYPRSLDYDLGWVVENRMGPHPTLCGSWRPSPPS